MNPLMKNRDFLRAAMEKASEPTTPSKKGDVINFNDPDLKISTSLDQLVARIHALQNRIKEIEERELKEARDELQKARENFVDALSASNLGIEEMEHR